MKYVIIGNSTAAIGGIEGIRSLDHESEITLVATEKHHTYCRPLISYLLYGKTDLERMKYRSDNFYEKNGVKALLGETTVKIDRENKKVVLESGKELSYDKLLIATGSRPFVPPIEGVDTVDKKFTFMSLDDALALEKAIDKNTKVLIMGAGLIGLKCAEGILDKAASITVADIANRILPSILDESASEIVRAQLEEKGIKFILGSGVSAFSKNTATLSDGKEVPFDVLVIASGVRPNTALISEAGGEVDRGIIIDESSKTSLDDIYAAGDCAQGYDSSIDAKRILALLPSAYMQGYCAGENMAGKESVYTKDIPMNAIGFFGSHIITAGAYEGEEINIDCPEGSYKKFFVKDGLLKGFILIGETVARAGIYTSLIREKTPLSTIDFDLISKNPQLMAFDLSEIQRKLGTRV